MTSTLKLPPPRTLTSSDSGSTGGPRDRRFSLNLQAGEGVRLGVVCGGLEHTKSSGTIHRAGFPFFGLEYVLRGRGEVRLDGHRFTLAPGVVFAYGPNTDEDLTSYSGEPLVKYYVDFVGSGALGLLGGCKLPPGHAGRVFPPQALQPIFEELLETGERRGRNSAALCERLLECVTLKFAGMRASRHEMDSLAFRTFQRCREHIAQHFQRMRTLGQISAECRVTSAHLCRLFHRYARQSPYQYLLSLKLHNAAEQLLKAGALVKDAAADAGFSDPFHFSRVFRKVLGVSPLSFRRLRARHGCCWPRGEPSP